MQVNPGWVLVLCCIAAGCKQPPPTPLPSAEPLPTETFRRIEVPQRVEVPDSAKSEEARIAEAIRPDKTPAPIFIGMKREQLVAALGHCGERAAFLPPGHKRMYVEVFQPKEGRCRNTFGVQQFVIVGGVLKEKKPWILKPLPRETIVADYL